MSSKIPTFEDISPTKGLDLDENYAVENFLGKSVEQAQELFTENDIHYAEDLMCMGENAFTFYFPAFANHLKSNDPNLSDASLQSLVGIVKHRVEYERNSIKTSKSFVVETLKYCIKNYSSFDIDEDIYKNLKDDLHDILTKVESIW